MGASSGVVPSLQTCAPSRNHLGDFLLVQRYISYEALQSSYSSLALLSSPEITLGALAAAAMAPAPR